RAGGDQEDHEREVSHPAGTLLDRFRADKASHGGPAIGPNCLLLRPSSALISLGKFGRTSGSLARSMPAPRPWLISDPSAAREERLRRLLRVKCALASLSERPRG